MDTREAYQELGVDPNVSDVELKAIWRRLVAAWHPDRNATVDASRRMQHINKAYQHIRQLRDGQSASTDDGGHAETQAGVISVSVQIVTVRCKGLPFVSMATMDNVASQSSHQWRKLTGLKLRPQFVRATYIPRL
jgi:DnaJ-class molecular chaperone